MLPGTSVGSRLVRVIVLATALILTVSDLPAAMQEPSIPADLTYEIFNESTDRAQSRKLNVRLSRKVDESTLEAVAFRLRDEAPQRYAGTYIDFYLPGMIVEEGLWAEAWFERNLEIRFFGPKLGVDSGPGFATTHSGAKLIGVWEYQGPGLFEGMYRLVNTGVFYILSQVYSDGSSRTEFLVKRGPRLEEPGNRFGEYYLIQGSQLELHDPEGLVFAAWKISESTSVVGFTNTPGAKDNRDTGKIKIGRTIRQDINGGWLNVEFIYRSDALLEAKACVKRSAKHEAVACFAFPNMAAYRAARPTSAGNYKGDLCYMARWQRNKIDMENGGENQNRSEACPDRKAEDEPKEE